MKKIVIASIITLFCLVALTQEQGILKDSRDGKEYPTVKIGSQIWMAKNLAYKAKSGIRAWGDDMKNVEKYGYLYDWAAAQEACPKGWHLPADAEWKTLELNLGMSPDEFDKNRKRAEGLGMKLKSATGWYENGNGNNESGFNAFPGGACLFYDNSYHFLGELAYFWTSTAEGSQDAYARVLRYDETYAERSLFAKSNSLSVRCVKD
ncbi:MAG TPA: fibrobacter succinogenes major paralogous domain-containing protein [Spirochaetota bacterium]|nr:fibrobacter succinogenes major paralogous domain-containing protein [Spirochaetota bacterium]HQF10094.1 fibrobacter succinogenes major paralogous domain-containing protein [Spirochaetota bacterium]HQH98834.1 fibrobacter succinogenes major paralogous domain-containing protein [Spirochaetota bacterium]HQJ70486.1 fibrobacter succinogenes major paralogous domain-containing protein [Spirochaetota bacterium]HRS78699.1 fibrobacter succinogenes major paralogous domain-containing protein [Spirochaeto